MKILFFINEPAGTSRVDVATLFGKYLPGHDIFSDIVTFFSHSAVEKWEGGKVFGIKKPQSRSCAHILRFFHDFSHLRHARKYDLLLIRDKPIFIIFALIWGKIVNVKCAYWMSYPFPEDWIEFSKNRRTTISATRRICVYARGKISYYLLYSIAFPLLDCAFLQSEEMFLSLHKRGIVAKDHLVVHMGIDIDALESINQTPKITFDKLGISGKENIIYFGSLGKERRIDTLISAFKIVNNHFPDSVFLICGAADECLDQDFIEHQISTEKLEGKVILTGWLPMTELWGLASAAIVGWSVLPRNNIYDVASPTKIIEYMGLGLAVVANDQPAQKDIIKRSRGGLICANNPEQIALQTMRLIRDPHLATTFGMQGKAWALKERNYTKLSNQLAKKMISLVSTSAIQT